MLQAIRINEEYKNSAVKKIEPVIHKLPSGRSDDRDDLNYWLLKTPEERIMAMGILQEQYFVLKGYKSPPKIEKTVMKRKNG